MAFHWIIEKTIGFEVTKEKSSICHNGLETVIHVAEQ